MGKGGSGRGSGGTSRQTGIGRSTGRGRCGRLRVLVGVRVCICSILRGSGRGGWST